MWYVLVMDAYLAGAGALSLVTAVIHVVAGGRENVRPLLRSELADGPQLTLYYCWHMATLTLLAISGVYVGAALSDAWLGAARFATVLVLAYATLSATITLVRRRPFADLPQWVLFGAIGAVGLPGVWA